MKKVFSRPQSLKRVPFHYCPGCGHSTLHRLIGEIIDEMDLRERIIGVPPAGCAVLAYNYFDIDMGEAAHGRAAALATGLKRALPDRVVFTYQGDGDIAAIGTAETVHAAARGEMFTTVFVNNGVYGMTGGQMAPTTLPGMKSSTSPYGRDVITMGFPLKITELVAQLPGTIFVTRQAVHTPANVRKTKKAVRMAFENQLNKKPGLSFIEIVSNCNSGWKMTPNQSNQWMVDNMFPYYPLGDIKVDGVMVSQQLSVSGQQSKT